MAYAFAVTGSVRSARNLIITLVETDVGTTDEFSIPHVPSGARLSLYKATRTDADLATTLQPKIGFVAGLASEVLCELGTAAAEVRIQGYTNGQTPLIDPGRKNPTIYGRSRPDAHANTITTELTFDLEGS
jgi:hypothetical protein